MLRVTKLLTNFGQQTRRVLLLACVLLAACSAGGEGDSVGFGSGQAPDPVALEFPVVYIARPIALDNMGAPVDPDVRELLTFNIGADLYFRDRAAPSTPDVNLTGEMTQGLADIRDVSVSYNATKVAFAMRVPFDENLDDDEQPTWNIWEFDVATRALRRVIASDLTAEAGHDIAPRYLADGRLLFSSTRQRQSVAILLDEGKPQFAALDESRDEMAFVLHTMQTDGAEITQVGFNQSHEFDPLVLDDGRIAFSRWDNMGGINEINFYRMNPDGEGLELLYGANSHDVDNDGNAEQFTKAQMLPNGNLLALLRPFSGSDAGGAIIEIDSSTYLENTQANAVNVGMGGPAQTTATINNVVVAPNQISPGGRFRSVYPLRDGTDRLLVSWSQCRLQDANARILPCDTANLADPTLVEAPSLYGIWLYDRRDNTQLPVVVGQEGFAFSDIVAVEPRAFPPIIFSGQNQFVADPSLAGDGEGVLNIRSVYDFLGADTAPGGIDVVADPALTTAAQRPARFLRIVKAVSLPDEDVFDFDNTAFGRSAQQGMREIVGYSMIEPDGSVMVKVPADVALAVSVLDASGQRITQRHQNWLQLRPGQELKCNGCHDRNSGLSHGRYDAFTSAHDGAVTAWQPYPNTDPNLSADMGESMAEVRARISCSDDSCSSIEPSVDVVFNDVWTDPATAGRAADASFSYDYASLTTPAPTTSACQLEWNSGCRITIHYEDHIHPMWSAPRQTLDNVGMVIADNTCTQCHTDRDAMGALQVPIAQLDLTDGVSPDEADHFKSYRELLFNDNEQELDMGALQDRLVQVGVDPVTMLPIFATVTVTPSMRVGGARASAQFFAPFAPGNSHAGYLTASEMKLIAEWLDIGAQYFNDPFAAGAN